MASPPLAHQVRRVDLQWWAMHTGHIRFSRHDSGSIGMRTSLTHAHAHTVIDRTGITHSMQVSLVARPPLVSRSHWQPAHGKQPILLKKGALVAAQAPTSCRLQWHKKKTKKKTAQNKHRNSAKHSDGHIIQAEQLPGSSWSLWLHHMCNTEPSWLYPVVCMGHALCLRVTEILNLSPKEFNLDVGVLKAQALRGSKRQTR